MIWFSYLAILFANCGNAMKQYAMKNCGRRAPGGFNSICINFGRCIICFLVSLIFWFTVGMGGADPEGNVVTVLSGIGNAVSLFSWILASGFIPMSLIEIFNTFGSLVVPMILAPYIYNGDSVSAVQWIGCILLVISVLLFIDMPKKKSDAETVETRNSCGLGVKIAIVTASAVGTGAGTIFQKYYVLNTVEKGLGTIEYFKMLSVIVMMGVFAIGFLWYVLTKRASISDESGRIMLPYKRVWVFIIMAAIGLYICQYFSGIASKLPSAIYFPLLKGVAIAETVLLDTLVFKDKLTLKRIIALVLVIASIVLVNLP